MSGPMAAPARIVSLVPSATEIVCLLGAGGWLVGRSHECDFPDAALGAAVLTSQTTPAGTPGEIDAAVRERVEAGASLYRLDADLLRRLAPDVIITQDLCSVCSIDMASVRAAAATIDPMPRLLSLNPTTVEGVLDDVLGIGGAIGREAEAMARLVELRERLSRAAEFVNAYCEGPAVAFLEWTDPLYVGGHWVPQLIERAGGRCPLRPTVAREGAGAAAGPQQGERVAGPSVRVSPEALVESAPEFVVVSPCGMGLDAARRATDELARASWWRDLPAVRLGNVAVVDGNQMFSRPGPRLVDAFEWLVGWLNGRPGIVPEGFPWERRGGANPG